MLRTRSKVAAGTEEGLEKAAKPRPGEVYGYGEVDVAVVGGGGGVEGIGEGAGDGMWWIGGVAGFGKRGALICGSKVVWEEESSSKPTTGRLPLEASLLVFEGVTTGFFLIGILTSSSLEESSSSSSSSPSFSLEDSPSLKASVITLFLGLFWS